MQRKEGRFGKNPGEAEKEAKAKVLAMLPKNGEKISWTGLEKQARKMGMSLRTLRKNLDKLEKAGLVVRIVDTEAKPPRVYYRNMEGAILSEVYAKIPEDFWNVKLWMERFSKISDSALREHALKAFIDLQLKLLTAELTAMWDKAVFNRNVEQAQSFFQVMTENIIEPQINNIGFLCRAYGETTSEVLNAVFREQLKEAENTVKVLIKVLSKVLQPS